MNVLTAATIGIIILLLLGNISGRFDAGELNAKKENGTDQAFGSNPFDGNIG